ncbi:endoribonuclease MazF [soil metagenome]
MRSGSAYVPDRGDLVWLQFDPVLGHEQGGRSPALVLSPIEYNRISGLMFACPITRQAKGYRFEVPISIRGTEGAILSDHAKNLSWMDRKADYIGRAHPDIVETVIANIIELMGNPQNGR